MHTGCMVEGMRQAKGVCQLLGTGERRVDGRQRLVRIALQPQEPGQTSEGKYLNIVWRIDSGTAPLGITERQACLQVCAGGGQLPKFQQGPSQIPVRSHEAHWVL